MRKLSIGAAWLEAHPFIRRESALLLPVALFFIAVPMALMFASIPPEFRQVQLDPNTPRPELSGGVMALVIMCTLTVMGGSLSLYALALKPAISLKEALLMGFRRLPIALGASLTAGFIVALPVLVAALVAPRLAGTIMLIAAIIFSVRLMMLNAIVIDRPVGVIDALKKSWAYSRNGFLSILGFFVMISFAIMLAQFVAQMLFGVVGFAVAGEDGGRQARDLGGALALALGQLLMIVMIARLYRQVAH